MSKRARFDICKSKIQKLETENSQMKQTMKMGQIEHRALRSKTNSLSCSPNDIMQELKANR